MGRWPHPLWIAHRGAGKLAPENTLAAFRLGASHGYRAFECDVKLSRDGIPFLLHDDDLDRTTSGHGPAADADWSGLCRLDAGTWHGPAFAGEPLPTLEAIATFCLAGDHALNIEIKPSPGTATETGRVVAQAAASLWRGAPYQPLLSSFRPEALEAARQAEPALPRALLVDSLWNGWLEQAREFDCVAVVANHRLVDEALVERLHRAGLRALAYTVNDPASAACLLAWGLDGLITDAVDRFDPARERAAADVSPDPT